MPSPTESPPRSILYCIVPEDIAGLLHESLRRHFRDEPSVEVIVERRRADRREGDRRTLAGERDVERRRISSSEGRRVADQRSASVRTPVPPPLPRRAQPHADKLVFVQRLQPTAVETEDLDTQRLITRIQAGDLDLFGELYLRYFDRIYGYLRILLRDPHEAEDATQQTFIKVFDALPRYEARRPFRSWLFVVVRNHALDELRRRQRVQPVDATDLGETAGAAESAESLSALDWISDPELLLFVERLPLVQRQVLMLRYLLDLPVGEVADILERTPDDVRALQYRAFSFLRARLAALGRTSHNVRKHQPMRRPLRLAPVIRERRFALRS